VGGEGKKKSNTNLGESFRGKKCGEFAVGEKKEYSAPKGIFETYSQS